MKFFSVPPSKNQILKTLSEITSTIYLENVGRSYGSADAQTTALKGVNLTIQEGESLAIVGPSGSGKSTLLHLVGALDAPSEGKVIVAGRDLSQLNDREASKYRREETGFVFQLFNLIPTLSALDNVALPARLAGQSMNESNDRALRLLERVGLADRKDSPPDSLSGGQQQRVAIARALINDPKIILADEPTGALDSQAGQQVLDLLLDLVEEKNVTLLLATHSEDAVKRMNRVIRIEDGEVISSAKR